MRNSTVTPSQRRQVSASQCLCGLRALFGTQQSTQQSLNSQVQTARKPLSMLVSTLLGELNSQIRTLRGDGGYV